MKIQPETIDLRTKLWGVTRVHGVHSPEPLAQDCCVKLNFRSKLGYYVINLHSPKKRLLRTRPIEGHSRSVQLPPEDKIQAQAHSKVKYRLFYLK